MWACPSQTWWCTLKWLWSWQQAEVGLGRKGETFWAQVSGAQQSHPAKHVTCTRATCPRYLCNHCRQAAVNINLRSLHGQVA